MYTFKRENCFLKESLNICKYLFHYAASAENTGWAFPVPNASSLPPSVEV